MANFNLGQAILDNGVKNENFFNGRLLTAGDLTAVQTASAQHDWQLGRQIGPGVGRGLEVSLISSGDTTTNPPAVGVTSGLGLNAAGQAVALPMDVQLQLKVVPEVGAVDSACAFENCDREGDAPGPTGDGVYVLIASSTSAYQEQAPKREVGNVNKIVGCGSRYVVEGVEFRLERVDLLSLSGVGSATLTAIATLLDQPLTDTLRSKLRNWLAHLFLGTEEIFQTVSGTEGLLGFPNDPFALEVQVQPFQSAYDRYGALDAMAGKNQIADCDVPLALICWTRRGFQFLDNWAVRRPLTPIAIQEPWPTIYGPRRDSESVSGFLQFQDQLQELMLTTTALATVRATDWYAYLPAAGFLKVSSSGFVPATFFHGLDMTNDTIGPAFVRQLLHEARFVEPMNLSAKPPVIVYSVTGHPEYVVFARAEAPAPPVTQPPPPPAGPTVGRAVIDIAIDTNDFDLVMAKRDQEFNEISRETGTRLVLDPAQINVTLKDAAGVSYPVRFNPTDRNFERFKTGLDFGKLGRGEYTAESLPPGTYLATVLVTGFTNASQSKAVTAGATTTYTFHLTPTAPPPPPGHRPDPEKHVKADFVGDGYKDLHLIDRYARVGWPPKGWENVPPLPDPPDYFVAFVVDWANYFSATRGGDPIDPGDAGFYLNRSYDPHEMSEEPYAYVAFGAGGVYAPVVLTTTDYGLDGSVSASKAQLGGIDAETSFQLLSMGLTVDAFAGAWQGLVKDTLGVTTETATSLISEAREVSQALIGSVEQFSGVDQNLAKAMSDNKITGPADLANSEAGELAGKLNISETFAQRLIDQAQSVVPAAQWSLDSPNLGFKSQELAVFAANDIKSQGQLKAVFTAGSDAVKGKVASELGRDVGDLTAFVGTFSFQSGAQLKADRLSSSSVTSVSGVNAANKGVLLQLNVKTVGDLAGMSAKTAAPAFGGDEAQAATAIAKAIAMGNFQQ